MHKAFLALIPHHLKVILKHSLPANNKVCALNIYSEKVFLPSTFILAFCFTLLQRRKEKGSSVLRLLFLSWRPGPIFLSTWIAVRCTYEHCHSTLLLGGGRNGTGKICATHAKNKSALFVRKKRYYIPGRRLQGKEWVLSWLRNNDGESLFL